MGGTSETVIWATASIALAAVAAFALGARLMGCLGLVAAMSWPGQALAAGSPAMYAVGLAMAPLWGPTGVTLVARTTGLATMRLNRPRHRWAVPTALTIAAAAGWLRALSYVPFSDPTCEHWCVQNTVAVTDRWTWSADLVRLGAIAVLVAWTAHVAQVAHLAPIGTPVRIGVLTLAAVSAAEQLCWLFIAGWAHPESAPPLAALLHLAGAAAVVSLLLALIGDRLLLAQRIRTVTRALGSEASSVAVVLGRALHDPTLVVGHRMAEGDFVEVNGHLLGQPLPGRRRSDIFDGDQVVAVIDHSTALEPSVIARNLGPALSMAIQNEGLEVGLSHRVAELAASRRRLVDASDTARTRLERDLHDGAQHGVLVLALELGRLERVAALRTDSTAETVHRIAVDCLSVSTRIAERLRAIARGAHPVVLDELGLIPALQQLADTATQPFLLRAGDLDRPPAVVERAAFGIARDATATTRVTRIDIEYDGDLILRVWSSDPAPPTVADRAAVLGGTRTEMDGGWQVRLPCA